MCKLLFCVVLAGSALVATSGVQGNVRMMLTQHRYVQPVYMAEPARGSDQIFFEGEPIELAVMFVNASAALAVLQTQNVAPAEAIEAVLIRRDVRTPDKAAFALLDAPFLEDASVRTPARWGGSIALGQRTSLYIPLRVGPLSLQPGFYFIRATGSRLSCEAPCAVVDHSGVFTFEVRSTERLPERLDQLCRRAVRAVEDDRAEIAEQHLRHLLVEYPDSSVAFQIRGQLAERQGRWLDAAESYDRAAQLVESGRDKLRIEKDGGPVVSGSLRAFAARARERGRRE